MENIKRKNKILSKNILSIILAILFSFSFFAVSINHTNAYASTTTEYTDVLEDLSIDENFNADDYPAVSDDYSLEIIQLAESSDGELFIYVYAPSEEDLATSINMARMRDEDNPTSNLYNLTLLNSSGTLFKYLVEDVEVYSSALRYYNITSIYRNFITGVDSETDNDNTTDEIAYKVAQLWTFCTVDDVTYSYVEETKVVEITNTYTGYIRYHQSNSGTTKYYLDNFYVSFSVEDYDIDDLLSAEISFTHYTYTITKDYTQSDGGVSVASEEEISTYSTYYSDTYKTTTSYGEQTTETVSLSSDSYESVTINLGWNAIASYFFDVSKTTYTWGQIESVDDFVTRVVDTEGGTLSTTASSNLSDKEWVLNFYSADYSLKTNSVSGVILLTEESGVRVTNTTILRLTFETCGVQYCLGVVSNKTTGSTDPSGTVDVSTDLLNIISNWFSSLFGSFESIWTYLKYILLAIVVLAVVTLLSIFTPFLRLLMELVIKGITLIFKALWWIISSPFKFLIDFIKGDK